MGRFLRSFPALVPLVGLMTPLIGCTTDEPAPSIVVSTPQPARGVISVVPVRNFESGTWQRVPIPLSDRGKLDITVNWTFPDTWMYVYFGETACDYAQLSGGTCPFLITSETMEPKPRVLYTDLLDPKTYYLALYNVPRDPRLGIGSDNTETVQVQLGLTVGFRESAEAATAVRAGPPVLVSPPRP
jgi:hypothetical protein